MKPDTLRVYLSAEAVEGLNKLCAENELGKNELMSKIAVAGIRALQEHRLRILLPIRFAVVEDVSDLQPAYIFNDARKAHGN